MVADKSLHNSIISAVGATQERLQHAREDLAAAVKAFTSTPGILSWYTIGERLSKDRETASHYDELIVSLKAIETAIARAEVACDSLSKSTRSSHDGN